MHATARVNGTTIAETDAYKIVDGNVYFPPSSITKDNFSSTATHTTCPYKGKASYYTIEAGGHQLNDAAWYYPEPKSGFEKIRDYVAFYKGSVEVKAE
ncbi:DUF427-domain-containing protein [Zopfia rhizophila CBS 207.26]|uniref:DUF427-domain-containing protein n=1 Tax=Zopfia rhizophila CBS 207.26 TaxID=1314779 RepID=A0A6A6E1N0_9PEZI|nr:DUF427-domain-containing protein [Zopfia rhizophila CBS 207.26]